MTTGRFHLLDSARKEGLGPEKGAQALLGRQIPHKLHDLAAAAPTYRPSPEMTAAVNVALAVGAPLLVTGDPGTGKTQLAYYLAWYFGAPENVFKLDVKSTTTSGDLLYTFDTIHYFHDGQDKTRTGPLDKNDYVKTGPLWEAFLALGRGEAAVVLIDEIDKAQRDFPNDVLHELDQYSFRVKELDHVEDRPKVPGTNKHLPPPVVVITSNNERRLPEPFLRRCIFHQIKFTKELVDEAVAARRLDFRELDDATVAKAVRAFLTLREHSGLRKVPATGELLVWLCALGALGVHEAQLDLTRLRELPAIEALIKDSADLDVLGR